MGVGVGVGEPLTVTFAAVAHRELVGAEVARVGGSACRGGGGAPASTIPAAAHPVLRRYCVQQSAGWLAVGVGVAVGECGCG